MCTLLTRVAAVLWLSLALATSPAFGQIALPSAPSGDTPEINAPLTEAEAQALVSRLSDQEVRAILLDQLGTEPAADPQAGGDLATFLNSITVGAFSAIQEAVVRLPRLISGQQEAFSNFTQTAGGLGGLAAAFGLLALAIAIGAAAEWAMRRYMRTWAALPPPSAAQTLGQTLSLLAKRLLGEALGLIVFMIAASTAAQLLVPETIAPIMRIIVFNLIVLPRLAAAGLRFVMAPRYPAYRLLNVSDADARAIERDGLWLVALLGLSVLAPQFNALNGVPLGETRLGFWLNFIVHAYVVYFALRHWTALQNMMRGSDPDVTPAEAWISRAYPGFLVAMSAITWWIVNTLVGIGTPEAFALLGTAPHYKTLFLLGYAPALDTAIRGLVRHLVPPMSGEGTVAERAHAATLRSYKRIGRVVIFGVVLIIIAGFWGMSPTSIASAGVGERVAARLIEFLMILSIGYLLYEVVSLYINRKLAAEMTASGYDPDNEDFGGDGGGAGGSRLSTVLPLVLAVSRVAIVTLFVLLGLSNIGVDTTPLLAGAGIVGLAIGFGAQKLVTDVVSGIFFLVDDAFRTGEYVEVDGTMGTVEKISIRSMQLRHHKGPVHTIPYGEVPKLTNYSRDWVIMKLKFTVPFDTDPNKVKKIFKTIGQDLLQDEVLGDDFLQPFKSQGVFEIDDVGMVIRGKFMAKPGKQFMIRKEIFNRVKASFEAAGIDFARREVRVALPDKANLTDEDKDAIAAAASAAAEAAQQPGAAPGDDR